MNLCRKQNGHGYWVTYAKVTKENLMFRRTMCDCAKLTSNKRHCTDKCHKKKKIIHKWSDMLDVTFWNECIGNLTTATDTTKYRSL